MQLTGIRQFGPIGPFETIELPAFSLIIGPNGVGKSQFLQAISRGNIIVGKPAEVSSSQIPMLTMPPAGVPSTILLTNSDALPNFGAEPISQTMPTFQKPKPEVGRFASFKAQATESALETLLEGLGASREDLTIYDGDPWSVGIEVLASKFCISPPSVEFERIERAFQIADDNIRKKNSGDRGVFWTRST